MPLSNLLASVASDALTDLSSVSTQTLTVVAAGSPSSRTNSDESSALSTAYTLNESLKTFELLPPSHTGKVEGVVVQHEIVLKESPGQGLGLYALAKIPAGSLVLAEEPLLVASAIGSRRYQSIREAFSRLTEDQQKKYLALAASPQVVESFRSWDENKGPDGDERARVHAIEATNAWQWHNDNRAVLFLGSRLNSSCYPNVSTFVPIGGNAMQFVACADIAAGEELTVTYIDSKILLPRSERQELLKATWQFDCRCEACEDSGAALVQERRRKVIREVKGRDCRFVCNNENEADWKEYRDRAAALVELLQDEPYILPDRIMACMSMAKYAKHNNDALEALRWVGRGQRLLRERRGECHWMLATLDEAAKGLREAIEKMCRITNLDIPQLGLNDWEFLD